MLNRDVVDFTKNCYGDIFLEFLKDVKFAVTNGRITKEYYDFTYISPRGKSVIDYILTNVDDLDKCINCKVISITSVLQSDGLYDSLALNCHALDHSVVTVTVKCPISILGDTCYVILILNRVIRSARILVPGNPRSIALKIFPLSL